VTGLAVVGLAVVAATVRVADGWRLLMLGTGLAASSLVAPRLVSAGRPRQAAALVGTGTFAALALGGPWLRDSAPVVADYPALAAVPLAWATGWLLDRDA
jgi:hypothetical protein